MSNLDKIKVPHQDSRIMTISGTALNLLEPDPKAITLEAVAAGLASRARYSGQTKRKGRPVIYSVAEHSIYVSTVLEREHPHDPQLWVDGLLHDAAEAFLADIPAPLKQDVEFRRLWKPIEERVQLACAFALGGRFPECDAIVEVDASIVPSEKAALQADAPWYPSIPNQRFDFPFGTLSPALAYHLFIQRYTRLYMEANGVGREKVGLNTV